MKNMLQIQEFNLGRMVPNPSILIIAKRGSGKSFITREIMHHYRNIPGGIVVAPTDTTNSFYKHFFPDLYIHYNLKDTTLKKLLARQTMMMGKAKNSSDKIDPSAILIMDDCLSSKKAWVKNECISEVLMNGRHYGLTYIITMQTPIGITPDLRLNFDYVFLLNENSAVNKKKLWDNYASMFPTFDCFEKIFDKCTENYCAMVIDNRNPWSNLADNVFWFKAHEHKFSFGSTIFKDLHNKLYDPSYIKKRNAKMLQGFLETDSSAKNIFAPINNENCKLFADNDYLFDYFINEDKLKDETNEDIRDEAHMFLSNEDESSEDIISEDIFKDVVTDKCTVISSDYKRKIVLDSELLESEDAHLIFTECYNKNSNDKIAITECYNDQQKINNDEMLQFAYQDDTYQLSARITNLNNHKLIETLCYHIASLKNNKNN